VLFQSLMLATMTSLGPSPALGGATLTPMWGAYLLAVHAPWVRLGPACVSAPGAPPPSCSSVGLPVVPNEALAEPAHHGMKLPRISTGGTLGGVKSFDVMGAAHLSAGPQLSWLTPDSPREDLLRLRVLSPGWAVRYTWEDAHLSVGVAASTRFVMFGEDWPVVDVLTSEARIELLLP
jgi:hypothetical protein